LKYIGEFVTRLFGVEGEIYSKGATKLLIKDFKYTGLGPAGSFWVGTKGNQPSSNGFLLQAKDQKYSTLGAYDGTQQDIELSLPPYIQVSDLKWISIWCKEFSKSFGDVIIGNDLVTSESEQDDSEESNYVGDFATRYYGVEGEIHSKGPNKLLIKNFKYSGLGPAATFWAGTKGNQPSSNGILLQAKDQKHPTLGAYDGTQPDIELSLPPNVQVSDLKWISIWCKEFSISYGDFIIGNDLVTLESEQAIHAPCHDDAGWCPNNPDWYCDPSCILKDGITPCWTVCKQTCNRCISDTYTDIVQNAMETKKMLNEYFSG